MRVDGGDLRRGHACEIRRNRRASDDAVEDRADVGRATSVGAVEGDFAVQLVGGGGRGECGSERGVGAARASNNHDGRIGERKPLDADECVGRVDGGGDFEGGVRARARVRPRVRNDHRASCAAEEDRRVDARAAVDAVVVRAAVDGVVARGADERVAAGETAHNAGRADVGCGDDVVGRSSEDVDGARARNANRLLGSVDRERLGGGDGSVELQPGGRELTQIGVGDERAGRGRNGNAACARERAIVRLISGERENRARVDRSGDVERRGDARQVAVASDVARDHRRARASDGQPVGLRSGEREGTSERDRGADDAVAIKRDRRRDGVDDNIRVNRAHERHRARAFDGPARCTSRSQRDLSARGHRKEWRRGRKGDVGCGDAEQVRAGGKSIGLDRDCARAADELRSEFRRGKDQGLVSGEVDDRVDLGDVGADRGDRRSVHARGVDGDGRRLASVRKQSVDAGAERERIAGAGWVVHAAREGEGADHAVLREQSAVESERSEIQLGDSGGVGGYASAVDSRRCGQCLGDLSRGARRGHMICARRTVGRLHGPCRRGQESERDESERWPRMAMHVSLRHWQDLQNAYCLTTTRSHQPTHAKMNRLPDEGETLQDHSEEASEQTLPVGIDQIALESRGALEMECRYRTLDGAGDAHNFVGRPRTLPASNQRREGSRVAVG